VRATCRLPFQDLSIFFAALEVTLSVGVSAPGGCCRCPQGGSALSQPAPAHFFQISTGIIYELSFNASFYVYFATGRANIVIVYPKKVSFKLFFLLQNRARSFIASVAFAPVT
jgi:hypothetical protein